MDRLVDTVHIFTDNSSSQNKNYEFIKYIYIYYSDRKHVWIEL